jgi:hypothetical protein
VIDTPACAHQHVVAYELVLEDKSRVTRWQCAGCSARFEPERKPLTKEALLAWVLELYRGHRIDAAMWNNGELGVFGVPAKYIAVFQDLCTAMLRLGEGESLPKLLQPRRPGYQRGANTKRNRAQ